MCEECVKFGKSMKKVEYRKPVKRIPELEGADQFLVKDFHMRIRKSREKSKLTQEELAKKIREKASVIKRVEEGWKPPMGLIAKLERFFDITLKEEVVERVVDSFSDSKKLTIGDIVDIS